MEVSAIWTYIRDETGIWRLVDDWQVEAEARKNSMAARKISLVISFIKPPPAVNDDFFEEAIIEGDIYYL